MEWSEAVALTKKGSPYVGEVLDAAFSQAQAVIVLMTPDDEARLREQFRQTSDGRDETQLTPQARPNVLFEAGMAFGRFPDRTILIQVGTLRKFSDVGGRHVIKLNNSPQRRHELAQRLQSAGCLINIGGTDWLTSGNFHSEANNRTRTATPKFVRPKRKIVTKRAETKRSPSRRPRPRKTSLQLFTDPNPSTGNYPS